MRFNLFSFKILALVLSVTLLTARVGQFSREAFFAPIQNYLSNKDQITGEGIKKAAVFCKTKRSPDLFSPVKMPPLSPPSHPDISRRQPPLSRGAPDGICREIFIPPEVLA